MHKYFKDYFSNYLFVFLLRLLSVFILFLFSGLIVSKMSNQAEDILNVSSKVFVAFLIIIPQITAVLLYVFLSLFLIREKIKEEKLAKLICLRAIELVFLYIVIALSATTIKTFLCKGLSESTSNAIIFAFLISSVFVFIESFGKQKEAAIKYMVISIPICTLLMIFVIKGITAILSGGNGKGHGLVGNALIWTAAFLFSFLMSFVYEKYLSTFLIKLRSAR